MESSQPTIQKVSLSDKCLSKYTETCIIHDSPTDPESCRAAYALRETKLQPVYFATPGDNALGGDQARKGESRRGEKGSLDVR